MLPFQNRFASIRCWFFLLPSIPFIFIFALTHTHVNCKKKTLASKASAHTLISSCICECMFYANASEKCIFSIQYGFYSIRIQAKMQMNLTQSLLCIYQMWFDCWSYAWCVCCVVLWIFLIAVEYTVHLRFQTRTQTHSYRESYHECMFFFTFSLFVLEVLLA